RKFRANTSGYEVSDHFAIVSNAALAIHKDFLHGHDISLHARNFGNAYDLPRAVAETTDLNDHIDRGRNLSTHGVLRKVQTSHCHHRLQTAEGVTRGIGVNCSKRAIVA